MSSRAADSEQPASASHAELGRGTAEPVRAGPESVTNPAEQCAVPGDVVPLAGLALRRQPDPADPLGGQPTPMPVVEALRRRQGSGRALPQPLQADLSAATGLDLAPVRIHADGEAARLSRSVAATAFTAGTDIYFAAGAYAPDTTTGRQLLAHELGHLAQPEPADSATAASSRIGRADDPAEAAADRHANRTLANLRRQAATFRVATGNQPQGGVRRSAVLRRKPTTTPLPSQLRDGIEALSGVDMSGVAVHHDSAEPARLDAHAHTRGSDIYLAPGQQGHLAHEAWHVVQQLQGRARPSESVAGSTISADPSLEAEASRMGERALRTPASPTRPVSRPTGGQPVVQRVIRGLANITELEHIDNDWVQHYLDDLTDNVTHLYKLDIETYLEEHHDGWRARADLANVNGNHWEVDLKDQAGQSVARVLTIKDGNCGPHAVSVIQDWLASGTVPNGPGEAPAPLIQQVRAEVKQRLSVAELADEVRSRILAEIRDQDELALTGFGPRLQGALAKRQSLHQGSGQGSGQSSGQGSSSPPAEVDVWQLLERPVAEIRELVGRYSLNDRKHLAVKLMEKFKEELPRALKLPEDVVRLCSEYVRLAPKTAEEPKPDRTKWRRLPKVWHELLTGYAEENERMAEAIAEVDWFAGRHGYQRADKPQLDVHEIFEHDVLTLYPAWRPDDPDLVVAQQQAPQKGSQVSARTKVNRPILDLEYVGGRFHARCYLGMFSPMEKGNAKHKDIDADKDGNVQFHNVNLMNLGNPFKALLWCEDYLQNSEHAPKDDLGKRKKGVEPQPVVRSFLVPLSDVDWMLAENSSARPLDQDRGTGQFGSPNNPEFDTKLHPLIGSLVSFFHNLQHLDPEPNQTKLPLAALQQHLTGTAGDPRDMTTQGVAAQANRGKHPILQDKEFGKDGVRFADAYKFALQAYYASLEGSIFKPAVQAEDVSLANYKQARVDIDSVNLNEFPHVMAAFARIAGKNKPTVIWK